MEESFLFIVWKMGYKNRSGQREDGMGFDVKVKSIEYIGSIKKSKLASFTAQWINCGYGRRQIEILSRSQIDVRIDISSDAVKIL